MLSTLKLTQRLSCQLNASSSSVLAASNQQWRGRCWLHDDRKTAPELQDYEPYSKLPYYDGKKGHLMYVGNMTRVVKGIKMFSLSTSLVTIGAIPFIRLAIEESLTKAGVMGGISGLIFLTPFLLHFVTRKYVTDIYFNAETEVFTLATKSLFLRRKELEFHSTDVEVPFVGGAVVTHRVKSKPFFIERELFFNKDVYIKMVGYDQPHKEENKLADEDNLEKDNQEADRKTKDEIKKSDGFGLFTSDNENKQSKENKTGNESKTVESRKEKKKFGLFNE